MKQIIHKILNWEYWPMHLVYFPIYFLWLYYSFKSRSLFFFNSCNPLIKNGGFFNESKKEIYELIPQKYYPKTELIIENTSFESLLKTIKSKKIDFPFIAKPDIGLRGSAVKKINDLNDLKLYAEKANFDYLIQDLIPHSNEIGVFYVRFPNENKGKITGIVAKEFMIIKGNGVHTIEQLINQNPRFAMQLKVLKKEFGNKLQEILALNENINLMPYGNHCRGSKFLDHSDRISEKLTTVLNDVCLQIPEFYFGRLDIMFNTWEELENGKNFAIIELNGAASEPTHIYDPKHTIFFGWKTLAQHLKMMCEISNMNFKRGFPYLSYNEGKKQYKLYLEQNKKFDNFQ